MTGSFVLTLYFNTPHVCFHVGGLGRALDTFKEHTFWPLSQNAVTSFGDHGKQHTLHQITPEQQQIYSLSFRKGELHGKQHVYCPFWSCALTTKIDGSTNIQKSLLAVRKMVISTVKNGRLHYCFSPILFLTLLYTTLQWSLLQLVVFFIDHLTKAGDHHCDFGDFLFFGFWMVNMTSHAPKL